MHFKYLNVSVAQKLTELRFFLSAAANSCYSSHRRRKSMLEALYERRKSMLEALYEKTYLSNCLGN